MPDGTSTPDYMRLLDPDALKKVGLERYDVTLDVVGERFDHLPVVVDLRPAKRR